MKAAAKPAWRRILLKLSGEALAGDSQFGIQSEVLNQTAGELKSIVELGVELAVVIGGGNFFRGVRAGDQGMDRITADYIGMLATVMNALALQQALQAAQVPARVLSALAVSGVAEPYIRARAVKHLQEWRVVIFAAGTGNPLFTTDTAASLRALEIDAQIMVKATRVDGVYDSDPRQNPDAVRFKRLRFREVIEKELKVIDMTAITLCQENHLPIQVLDVRQPGSLHKMIMGEPIGTLISDDTCAPGR